jgi:hypothetical protein
VGRFYAKRQSGRVPTVELGDVPVIARPMNRNCGAGITVLNVGRFVVLGRGLCPEIVPLIVQASRIARRVCDILCTQYAVIICRQSVPVAVGRQLRGWIRARDGEHSSGTWVNLNDRQAGNRVQAPALREAPCRSILAKSWVGHLMDGCHNVPPGSLVRMFTLFAQHEVQLARRNDGVECRTLRRFGRGHCSETPHWFLW